MNTTDWIQQANNTPDNQNEILSFNDYMDIFENHPQLECRATFDYIIDMLNYFGKDEDGSYKLFKMSHPDCPPVWGQTKVQHALLQIGRAHV